MTIIFNFEQNIPFKPIDIRTAICHFSDAWNEITISTIQNFWIKSTLVRKENFINNDNNAMINDLLNNIYDMEMVNEHNKNNELCQKMYGVEDSKIEESENYFAEEDKKLWLGNNDEKIIYPDENLESNNISDNLSIGNDNENEEFTNMENEEILEAIDNLRKF